MVASGLLYLSSCDTMGLVAKIVCYFFTIQDQMDAGKIPETDKNGRPSCVDDFEYYNDTMIPSNGLLLFVNMCAVSLQILYPDEEMIQHKDQLIGRAETEPT